MMSVNKCSALWEIRSCSQDCGPHGMVSSCKNGKVDDDYCPGVGPATCKDGEDVCRCKVGTLRKGGTQCVATKRECRDRKWESAKTLTTMDDVYAAKISDDMPMNFKTKCVRSVFKSNKCDVIERTMTYREMIG
ncbi:hypothetical protein V5799_006326, partial [Amblyomma americanum]